MAGAVSQRPAPPLSRSGPAATRRHPHRLEPRPARRSLRHLIDTITGLSDRGVGFRSLQEAIDTTTLGGKLVFHVFATLAEFERDLIGERTSTGRAAAPGPRRPTPRSRAATSSRWPQEMYACVWAVQRGRYCQDPWVSRARSTAI